MPAVKEQAQKRRCLRMPQYVAPYQDRHRPVTATLTNEEHAAITNLAESEGLRATTYVTKVLRQFLIDKRSAKGPSDDYESATLVYGDQG